MMKIPIGEKIGYGVGDIASNVIWQMVMFFLPIFYTDTFGLPAAMVGTMFIVVRFFDAINDPIMGTIADRTNTRWGKYRPYILWMAIPYGIGGVFMFFTPNFGLNGKIIYAYTTYIIMMMIYTAIMVPYNSLSGVMTSDSLERTSLNSYRFIGAFIGAIFIQGLALYLVDKTGTDNQSIVKAHIQNNHLVFEEKGPGTAKVTITASDREKNANQVFLIKINREGDNPPEVVDAPKDIALKEGFGTYRMNISDIFKDVDGDKPEITAKSTAIKIINTTVKDGELLIEESGIGKASVMLTATDEQGNSATVGFDVKISKKGNLPPEKMKELQDLILLAKDKKEKFNIRKSLGILDEHEIDMSGLFNDPDDDELFYKAKSDNPDVASVTSFNSTLLLKKKSSGKANITIIADDNHGGMAQASFAVHINPSQNSSPVIRQDIKNVTLKSGFSEYAINMEDLFDDNEGDNLTYSFQVNNDARGYQRTMVIFGIFSVFLFFITFSTTRERVQPIAKEKSKLKDDFKDLLKNGPWLILFSVSLVTLCYNAIRSASVAYYFRYFVGDDGLTGAYLVSGSVTIILMLLATKWLTKIFGKRPLYVICMLFVAASLIGYHFLKPNQIVLIFLLNILQSIGSAPSMPLLWSMYADTSDYSEWKNGRKAMGLAYSASTFAQKAGIAVGGAIALWLLAFYGYQPNVEQSETSLLGMRLMMGIYPSLGAFLCAVLIWFYKLDGSTMNKIETELAERRKKNH